MKTLSTKDTVKYLHTVRDLEKSLYMQDLYLNELSDKIDQARNPKVQEYEHNYNDQPKTGATILAYTLGGIGITLAIYIFGVITNLFSSRLPGFYKFILYAGPIVSFVIGYSVSRSNKEDYEWKKSVIENNNYQISKKNDEIRALCKKQEPLLVNEYNHALAYFNKTQAVLNKFYNTDVIYPKYRELVAVTMFCEYFDSGVCTSLTGHEGAYNKYDLDEKLGNILTKLDDIIVRLDRIEQNQYMLAHLISSCQNNIQRLIGFAEEQLSVLHEIKESQQASEYYYRITAENTNATKWLVYLNSVNSSTNSYFY